MNFEPDELAVLSAIGKLQEKGKEPPYTLIQIVRNTPDIDLRWRITEGKSQVVLDSLLDLSGHGIVKVELGRDKYFGKVLVYPL